MLIDSMTDKELDAELEKLEEELNTIGSKRQQIFSEQRKRREQKCDITNHVLDLFDDGQHHYVVAVAKHNDYHFVGMYLFDILESNFKFYVKSFEACFDGYESFIRGKSGYQNKDYIHNLIDEYNIYAVSTDVYNEALYYLRDQLWGELSFVDIKNYESTIKQNCLGSVVTVD